MEDCSWPAVCLPCDGGEGDSCPISCAPCTVAAGWAVQGQGQGGTEIPSAECAALPAAVGALENCCIKWIADTGSAHHLTDKTALEGDLRSFIRRNPDQVRLATANGVIPAKAALDLWVPEMGARARVLVLPQTPSVLSVGRLVENNQYEFHWTGSGAFFKAPCGRIYECAVENDVPTLTTEVCPDTTVASAVTRDASDAVQTPGAEMASSNRDDDGARPAMPGDQAAAQAERHECEESGPIRARSAYPNESKKRLPE